MGENDSLVTGVRCVIGGPPTIVTLGVEAVLLSGKMTIVACVSSPADIREVVRRERLDLIVSCFEPMGEALALAAVAEGCPLLVLCSRTTSSGVIEAFRAGARGVLARDALADELLAAARQVASGGAVLPNEWESCVWADPAPVTYGSKHGRDVLTTREREVMSKIVEGCSNKQVARELGIAEQTVKNHVCHIMAKAGVSSRLQLLRWALQTNVTLRIRELRVIGDPEGDPSFHRK